MDKYIIEFNRDELTEIQLGLVLARKDKEQRINELPDDEKKEYTKECYKKEIGNIKKVEEKLRSIISNKDFFDTKVKEFINENVRLKSEINDLKWELEDLGMNDEGKENIKVGEFFDTYENVQNKYDSNNVNYQMTSIEDVTKVFGLKMYQVKGFRDLTEEDQITFERGIVKFLNGWGLGNRVRNLPVKVWKVDSEFRFLTLRGGEREQYMNNKGEVY